MISLEEIENFIEVIIDDCRTLKCDVHKSRFSKFKRYLANLNENSIKSKKSIDQMETKIKELFEVVFKRVPHSSLTDNVGQVLLLILTNSIFQKYAPIALEYWPLFIEYFPKNIDNQCLQELLLDSFGSKRSSWISSRVLLNIINSDSSQKFSKVLVSTLIKNKFLFKSYCKILLENKDFTNCNYIIDIMNRLNKISSTDLLEMLAMQNSSQKLAVKIFPVAANAGCYSIITYLSNLKKDFSNLFQLTSFVNSNNFLENRSNRKEMSFVQILDKVMIVWMTYSKQKLVPIFINLHNLIDVFVSKNGRVEITLSSQKAFKSVISNVYTSDNDKFGFYLKRNEILSYFIKCLKSFVISKPRKISVVHAALMVTSKGEYWEESHAYGNGNSSKNPENISEELFSNKNRETSIGSQIISSSPIRASSIQSSISFPCNQLAIAQKPSANYSVIDFMQKANSHNALPAIQNCTSQQKANQLIKQSSFEQHNSNLKEGQKDKSNESANSENIQLSPSTYIEKMKKESRMYGKAKKISAKSKDIWEVSSSAPSTPHLSSTLNSPQKELNKELSAKNSFFDESVIPDSLEDDAPLITDKRDIWVSLRETATRDEFVTEENQRRTTDDEDSAPKKRRRRNLIPPSSQFQSQNDQVKLNVINSPTTIRGFSQSNAIYKPLNKEENDGNVIAQGILTKNFHKDLKVPKIQKYIEEHSQSLIGNSTTIGNNNSETNDTGSQSMLEDSATTKTTFTEYEKPDQADNEEDPYRLMSQGLNTFSLSIISKLKSLEEFISNKEREMRSNLEIEFEKIQEKYRGNLKLLHEYFMLESKNILDTNVSRI